MKKHIKMCLIILVLNFGAGILAQTASVTWPLTINQNPNAPIGNIQSLSQFIGTPTSPYKLEMYPQQPYASNGQQLWTGNQGTGWIAGLPDYTRYIQFDANPTSGNDFTVLHISFQYSDYPTPTNADFHLLKGEVWYSTDNWNSTTGKVQLNSNPLDYLSSTIQTFSANVNVLIQNGQTFSLRIYPYAPNGGRAMTPSFATHKNVIIEGRTSPVVTTGSICGMKFNDLNGNSRKDSGEPGIQGWTINLSMGAVNMTATTGADGSYCFNNLSAGTYTLSEGPQGGWEQTYPINPSTHTVVLPAGQSVLNVDFGNKQLLGSICGMKFNDLNSNSRKDSGEPGIQGWTINLSMGAVNMTATTGADGSYCFNNLPAGTYTLSEGPQGGWEQTYPTNPSTHTVILAAGQTVLNVDFGNKQLLGSICGMKFNDLNGNGINDSEPGLAGWIIELKYNGSNGVVTLRDTTDSSGNYCFNNLPFGNYTITEVNKPGWTQTAPASPGSYTITINEEVNLIGKDFGNKEILNPNCTDFENNSLNGWQANNISTSFQQNGNNHYIQTTDQAGVSTFYTTSKPFTGNWTSLFSNGCGSLCFDINFIYGGDVYNGVTPPQTLTPYIALEGAGFKASFVVNQSISVGSGWHSYCAPLSFLNSDGTLPSNSDGYWIMTAGTASDWNTLLTNVTKVRLLADPTSYQNEKIGYDNICLKNTGDCNSPSRTGSICGLKILDKDGDGERDANEDIIPNWGITLSNGTTSITATTDANGQYCFDNLPAGTYTVSEEHRTGFRQIFPPSPGVHTITLLPGENKTNINFSNVEDIAVKLGSICGIKFNDINGDGDQDPGELGLSNWTFKLSGAANMTTTTDVRGYFCFTNLTPGDYIITEIIQDGWEVTTPNALGTYSVNILSGQNLEGVLFGNKEKLGSICGMKYNDLNNDGDWDSGEPGLPGWQITLSSFGYAASGHVGLPTLNLIGTITTDRNGNYCFTNLKPGNYIIGEIAQNGWTQTEPASFIYGITLTPGQNINGLNFGNKVDVAVRVGSICGIKFNDKDGDGVQDSGELGIPDWHISIEGPVDMTIVTDKNGKFCFENLPPGEYKVGEEFRTGWRKTKPTANFYIIQLASGQYKLDVDFGNTKDDTLQLGSICGTKFNDKNRDGRKVSGEQGIANWTIYLEGPMNLTAITDDNGNFCFYGLIPGTYTVREKNETGWRQTKPSSITYTLEVGNGDNFTDIDFGNFEDPTVTLGSICGMKFNDLNGDGRKQDNEPGIANWTIILSGTMNLTVQTDSRGKFCFDNLKFGRYTLSEAHKDKWKQTAPSTGSYIIEFSEDNNNPDLYYFGNKYEEPNIGCVNPPTGMVLWLPGDNNTNDISGFNNHGTVMFDLGYTAGKVNQAFIVNNFGYITVADNSSLNFGKENFSIDAWVKTTDITNTFSIVLKAYASSSFNITGYSLSLSQGRLRFIMGDGSTLVDKLETTIQIGDGLWHHVAVTIDRKNVNGGKMYIDGNLVLTFDPTSVSNSITNNSKMEIFDISNFYNHNGNQIDELEIFNRVITQDEIVSIFNAGSAGKCKTSVRLGSICGMKYFDKNGDGKKDLTEPGIDNWQINISGPVDRSIITNKEGKYCFDDLPPGTYIIKEEPRTDWVQTDPVSPNSYTVVLTSGQNLDGYYFGNKYEPKPGCVNPPSGMIAWWSLDLSSRDARQDLAGFNNFGTMVNGPLQVAGKVLGALQFDGIDDYVEVADHSELNFGTGDFSFDAWIKTNANVGVQVIVDKRKGYNLGYSFFLNDGFLSLQLSDGSFPFGYTNYASPVFVADGNWHHIAITVTRSNNQGILFYLDGVSTQYGNPTAHPNTLTNTDNLRIGRNSASTVSDPIGTFKGILDEIELFNRVLTPAEVLTIYNAGSAGKCKPNSNGGSVSGTVWHDLNHNGVKDPTEVGLAKWPVLLNGPSIVQTETDENGNYIFTEVVIEGNYTLSVAGKNDWSCTYPLGGRHPIKLGEAQTIDGLHFGFADDPCTEGQKTWSSLGSGVNGTVLALATISNDLYAGGTFSVAGGVNVKSIAKWNGSSWSDVGGGVNGIVTSLVVIGNNLYVAGFFSVAGNVSAKNIAMWDGSNWNALGDGVNNVVHALAASSTSLYVGGEFTSAGNVSASMIAKWNGVSWSALGSGMNDRVFAITVDGNNVYAGGEFTTAGNVNALHVAKWNGVSSSWSPVGTGLNNNISALTVKNGEVYAGGSFNNSVGFNTINRISKWDGTSWTTLGNGITGGGNIFSSSIAFIGMNMYTGGLFTTAGTVTANNIAMWDGNYWTALGSGINGVLNSTIISALATNGIDLFVGGSFTTAGRVFANNIAKYSCSSTTTSIGDGETNTVMPTKFQLNQNYPNPFNPTTTIRYDIPKAGYVKISVYDILGREIKVLVNEEKNPGVYEVKFDAKYLASGIYFYTIRTSGFTQSRKMILLR